MTELDTVPGDFDPAIGIVPAEGLEDASDGRIQLEGLPNTRDIGGIPAADGRFVKHARLLRSGALVGATERDLKALVDDFDLRTVVDLRTEEEARAKPDPLDLLGEVRYVSVPLLNPAALGIANEGGVKGMLKAIREVEGNPASIMERVYVSTVLDERGQHGFARFFDAVLATEQGSVLWHCSAGKDRTGMAAALLLWVLGASDEDIMADYLASNRYLQNRTEEILNALASHGLAGKLDSSVRVLNSVRPDFLLAARDAAVKHYGSVDAYLERALNVTPVKREVLRARYLTDDRKG